MRIGEVFERTGVPVKTIRYYEEIGLLEQPARTPSGYRAYGEEVVDRLAFIRAAQRVGLPLAEIGDIIAVRDRGDTPCAHVLSLIELRAADIREQIAELQRLGAQLDALTRRGKKLDPKNCAPSSVCHIIVDG